MFPADQEKALTAKWTDRHFNPIIIMDTMYFNDDMLKTVLNDYNPVLKFPLNPYAAPLQILTLKKR